MALSGTINGRVTLNSRFMSFYITWSANQNVEGNYSDVTVTSYWKTNNTRWGFDTEGSRAASITINGNTTSISKRFDSTNGTGTGWKQENPWSIQTVTERVYHNSDGSKSISISARANGYAASYGPSNSSASSGDCTASGTISLDTIPRASKVSATNADIGSTSTITVSRYSTSFKHNVSFSCQGISDTVIESNSEASVIPWNVPVSIYATIPAAKYATVTITCRTYSKDTGALIGKTTATMKAIANEEECKPTVSGAVTDVNATTVSLTGNAKTLIRYKSTASCKIVATAKNSASISAQYVNGVSIPSGTVEIQNSEAVSFAFSATDSRGYSSSALVEPTVIPYIPLTINPTFSRVSPTSNIITVEFYGNFFSGNFGASSNALKVKYRYKEYGTETWSAYVAISSSSINIPGDGTYNSNGAVTLGSNFDYRKSYDMEIVAQDGSGTAVLSNVSSMVQVTRGEPVFDWSNEDFRVRETLHTKDVQVDGKLTVGGKTLVDLIYPVGAYYRSSDPTSPEELFGGTWEEIHGRFLFAADDAHPAGSTGGEESHILTEAEIAPHKHAMAYGPESSASGTGFPYGIAAGSATNSAGGRGYASNLGTFSAGGGQPHNNMPPYLATYTWHRIA